MFVLFFFLLSFSRWRGEFGDDIILLLHDIAASQRSKKRPCFLEAILQHLKKKEKPARRAGSKQGGQSVLNDIFYVIGSHIIKPLFFFLGFFYSFSASSTPPFRVRVFSFLPNSPPPILFSVNRLSIRLPTRISSKIENSSPPQAYVLPLWEQSTIPIRFNNEFGVNVNWDQNKQRSSVTRPNYCHLFLPKSVYFILVGRTARPVPCLTSSYASAPWPWRAMVRWRGWGGIGSKRR